MDKTKSTTAKTKTGRDVVLPRSIRRVLQNFLLVWLDANIDESKEDLKKSLAQLRHIVASINTYTNAEECVKFIEQIKEEKIFMIVSGTLGQHIVPEVHEWPQIDSIYVFCGNKSVHELWAKTLPKVKGVHTNIDQICQALQTDRERCDQTMISISFRGIDPLFMYTQLLKEALLEIEDDDEDSIKELAEYCRSQDDIPEEEIKMIEKEYNRHSPIWWYTAPIFLYSTLNRGLRVLDFDIILRIGFFIRQLHRHIEELHREQQQESKTRKTTKFVVYRGQGLSEEDFGKLKQTKGGLMSFNNFLSTSHQRDISLQQFARPAALRPNFFGVLFVMNIDPQVCIKSRTPFVEVAGEIGYFQDREAEILFSTHTIFRIDEIQRIPDKDTQRLYQVNLALMGNDSNELNALAQRIRIEIGNRRGLSRLGALLIKAGECKAAEKLYEILLEKATSDSDKDEYNGKLGWVYDVRGEYSKALSFYERSLEIKKKILPPNHPNLAGFYSNIGLVYFNMGEYSKALSFYEQSLELRKKILPPNHPDFTGSYNNIGGVYYNTGEYSKALSFFEQSLEIQKKTLPPKHPDFAASYNNMGMVYKDMKEWSKALSFYEQSLEIKKKTLPPNHPDVAKSYMNIGNVYYSMGEYSEALSSHEQSLEIRKKSLPPNHPDLAKSYWAIAGVHSSMGDNSKALQLYERALQMLEISLPPTHPDIATVKRCIDIVKKKI